MHTKGLLNNWYIIVGIDLKGNIKFKELFESTLENIGDKILELNNLNSDLTYFGYQIKSAELL